ncbi:MAG TPA: tyrosine-type recombinase/integrase [Acidimicrobiales bacterium]|jgi:integrase
MKGHVAEVIAGKKYRVFVYAGRDPVTGKKRYRTKVATGSRKGAEAVLHRLAAEVADSTHVTATGTFGDLVEKWFTMASPDWSPATVVENRRIIDTKLVALGRVRLDKITAASLDAFYGQLRAAGGAGGRPLSGATVRRIHVVVRAALEQGVRWGWLLHNPAHRAYTGKVAAPTKRVPTAAIVSALIREAWDVDPDLATLLTLEAHCGERRSELLALRWTDFDPDGSALTVSKAIVKGPNGLVEKQTTKTGRDRVIVVAAESVALLLAHRSRLDERCLAVGISLPDDSYIFSPELDGSKPWWPSSVSRSLRLVCNRLGVEPITFRELRRFVASTMVTGGVDMTTEAEMLGHGATIALTHYTRSDRATQARASRVVVDALSSASTTAAPQPES